MAVHSEIRSGGTVFPVKFAIVGVNSAVTLPPQSACVTMSAMFNLTREQQIFVCLLLMFLALGWGVRAWRTAHPPVPSASASP